MKKALLGGLVLALALVFGQAGTSRAASVNIVYDGYCDGANLNYDIFTGLASGVQTGPSCSPVVSGPMLGTVADIFAQGPALTMGYDPTATFSSYGFVTVIRADHTWTHYQNSGGGITVANSGTWSFGTAVRPRVNGGKPSSFRK